MTTASPVRRPTPVDAIADAYVTTLARLNPLLATEMGVDGYDHLMTDLSPAGWQAQADAARAVLTQLDGVEPVDDVDRVTVAAMRERIGLEVALHEADEWIGQLNNIASPVQGLRDVFDLMPTENVEHWSDIAARLNALPGAVDGLIESLRLAASRGRVAPIRQVRECITQAEELAGEGSFFTTFVQGAEVETALAAGSGSTIGSGAATGPDLRADLDRGAAAARSAYGDLASFLRDELGPHAPEADAARRER